MIAVTPSMGLVLILPLDQQGTGQICFRADFVSPVAWMPQHGSHPVPEMRQEPLDTRRQRSGEFQAFLGNRMHEGQPGGVERYAFEVESRPRPGPPVDLVTDDRIAQRRQVDT